MKENNSFERLSLVRGYVWANTQVKGRPNMTSIDFCRWVNESLPPNSTLGPVSLEKLASKQLVNGCITLGFEVLTAKKGIFIDGHERDDVVQFLIPPHHTTTLVSSMF